jgi:MscS family membrane protein
MGVSIGIAFRSQTTYLSRDSGLDAERGQQAESEVEKWRSRGQLPFPDFDEGLNWDKQDILDYPPKGSPGYTPRPERYCCRSCLKRRLR